jgi:hypothetical protein
MLDATPGGSDGAASRAARLKAMTARASIWLAAAAVTTLTVGLYFAIPRRVPNLAPVRSVRVPALNVTKIGNSLRLFWDPQLSREGRMVLWIKDGPETRRLELDAKQLSEGNVVYLPNHSDVEFQLEMLGPGGSATESILSIGGPIKTAAVVKPPTVVAPLREDGYRKRVVTASRNASRPLALPRPKASSGAEAAIPDAPAVRAEVVRTDGSKELLESIAPDQRSANAELAVKVRAEPVAATRRNLPLIRRVSRRADFVPPSVLHEAPPPDLPHRTIPRDVNINVKVYVNTSGKVDFSEVVSKVAESDRDLASLAVFAGRRWEFLPARSGGSAVAGEVILHYRFSAVGTR